MLRSLFKHLVDSLISLECRYFTRRERSTEQRLLIFRKDGMGDFIIFYPFLKYYRAHFKDYRISFVLPTVARDLKPLLTMVDEVIEFDAKQFSGNFWYRRAFIKNLVRQNFAVAIYPVFSREPMGDLIIKLTGAPVRIGFAKNSKDRKFYTDTFALPEDGRPEIDRDAAFTEHVIGRTPPVTFPTIDPSLFDPAPARQLAEQYHLIPDRYAIIFIGASVRYRIWPEDRFARIADYFVSQGITPVVAGGPNDRALAATVIRHMADPKKGVDLSGQTRLGDLAHLLVHSRLYFGNDTGALHLAAALNVPAVCLSGGGVFGRFFPYGDLRRNRQAFDPNMTCKNDLWACGLRCLGDERAPCIMGISVENALGVTKDLLASLPTP